MSKQVEVVDLPPCDLCKDGTDAEYDAKTVFGPWANLCKPHWLEYTTGQLGTGKGQKLVQRMAP